MVYTPLPSSPGDPPSPEDPRGLPKDPPRAPRGAPGELPEAPGRCRAVERCRFQRVCAVPLFYLNDLLRRAKPSKSAPLYRLALHGKTSGVQGRREVQYLPAPRDAEEKHKQAEYKMVNLSNDSKQRKEIYEMKKNFELRIN